MNYPPLKAQRAALSLKREQITGTKGHGDESVRRGAGRKIGRKGSGLWTTPKKTMVALK